jgi:two-component sensor histidine kinase
MKITHILWLSLCIYFPSQCQVRLDSLKALLKEAHEANYSIEEAYQRYQIGSWFVSIHQYDSALHYYHGGLEAQPRPADSASLFNGIGVVYSSIGLPDRGVPYYKQAISLWERLKDTTNVVIGSNNLAIIYKDLGLYDEALEISFNALPKLEHQSSRQLASFLNTIGIVYMRVQDYPKAYDYFRKGLAVRLNIKYDMGVAQSYNNIGEVFIEMSQYDSALNNLHQSATIRRKIGDTRGLARSLTLLGNASLQLGKPAEAKIALTEALTINRAASDNIGEVGSLNGLGSVHLATKEFALAEKELDQALSLINKTNVKENLKRNLELHVDLYRAMNNKSKLIETFERIVEVKDSLLNAEKVKSLVALEVRYETDKKEQEIISLQQQRRLDKAELKSNRIQIYSLSIGLLLLMTIGILGYRIYKQARNAKVNAELHTQEVQHRMKNHLQILSSIFTIQAAMLEDKKAQEVVRDIEGRVNAMGLLHKKLYSNSHTSEIELKEYVSNLIDWLLFTYGFSADSVSLDVNVADIKMPVEKAVRIGLIINELVTNSLKYAFQEQEEPALKVHLSKAADRLRLDVSDNGKRPFSFTDLKDTSFGLKMVSSLVKELKGQIEVVTQDGTHFSITIPG